MPRKEIIGRVISDKMEKTIVVAVDEMTAHAKFGKIVRHTRKFKAHDELNASREGDRVRIRESRPMSRDKRWEMIEVIERAEQSV
jgi:small subunit ribosomal protein S17